MRRLWEERNGGVTEKNWLAFTHPGDLLFYLEGNVSDRKLRLFACFCCRSVWDHIEDGSSRRAVTFSERYADGLATAGELRYAHQSTRFIKRMGAEWLGKGVGGVDEAAAAASSLPVKAAAVLRGLFGQASDLARQCAVLRDLVGNPFYVTRVEPAWLRWNSGTVRKLVEAIYNYRAFDRLPVLADALEDAGCADPTILGHCRSPGTHVRGCWVVDLLLGKA